MKDIIKKRIEEFKNDNITVQIMYVLIALFGLHFYQYFNSGFSLNCLYRVVYFGVSIVFTLIFGKKASYVTLVAFSFTAEYLNTFNNYTSLFCILMAVRMFKSTEKFLIPLYFMNTVFSLIYQNKNISHIAIHLLTAFLFYLLFYYERKEAEKDFFFVTEDEMKILEEMRKGKQLKELDLFNKNTITKKLKQARGRNRCATNSELLCEYIKRNPIN